MIFVLQVISAAARNYWKVFPNSTPPGRMNQNYAKIPTMCVLEKKPTINGTSNKFARNISRNRKQLFITFHV